MHGRRTLTGALTLRAMVAALILGAVFVVVAPAAPTVLAYNGGVAYNDPVAMPCTPDCQFTGDSGGGGLGGFPYNTYGNYNATWWSFTAPASKTYTFRATSITPANWDNTLTLTSAAGSVIAHNDDNYNLDAMISASLTSGTSYRLALGGYNPGSAGTATITISSTPPDAPTGVTGLAGDGSIALSWTAPNDHFAAITEYRIYVNGSAEYTSVTGTPPAVETTLTGLTNGATYTVRVSAVNGNGEGAKSAATLDEYVPFGATTTTIAFDPTEPVYGTAFDVVVTVSGSSTVDSGTVTLFRGATQVGAAQGLVNGTATWSNQSRPVGTSYYSAQYSGTNGWTSSSKAATPVVVSQATQTITFAQPADTAHSLGGVTLAPTADSGLTVALSSGTTSVCTVNGFTVSFVTGGTCTLTASQAGDAASYLPATSVERSFEITDAPQTITFAQPADRAWSASTFDVAPTSSSGLTVTLSSGTQSVCTVSGFTVTMVRTGTCTLTAAHAGNASFAPASLPRSFQITGAAQTVTFAQPADRAWSASTFDVAPSASTELTVTLASDTTSVCTVSDFTVTMMRTGTCTLTATQAGNAQYAAASQERSFDITSATQAAFTATATSYSLKIGATATVDASGGSGTGATLYAVTSGADHCSIVDTTVTATAVGTCVVTATKAADTHYAATSDATDVITVAKAEPAIAVTGSTSVLTGGSATVTVDVTGLVNGVTPGTITLQLSGATSGALSDPSSAPLVVAGNGLSGSATFTVTAGVEGTLQVNARMASTVAYTQADTATAAVLTVTAPPPALFPTVPTRIVDTRPGYPHVRPTPDRQLAAGEVLEVQFTDLPGLVPASGVNAVSLDIGVVGPDGDGFVTAYPCGDLPTVSSLNFHGDQTISNAAIVPVNDATGSVCFYPSRATHLIVDVTGWFATDNGFVDVTPTRLFDTRPGHDGIRDVSGAFTSSQTRDVDVTGIEGLVPAQGVAAVSLNITVVNPEGAGYVSAYACGERPNASSVNFSAGRTVANLAIVPLSADGSVCLYASQALHLVVDVTGWFEVGGGFDASGPARVFDTRPGYSGLRTVASERIGDATILTVQVTDLAGLVPADGVGAVSLNVTAIDPAADGFITVWACGTRPDASSLNYAAHRTTAGAVIAPVDYRTGTVCFYSSQSVHLAVDLNGWFISSPA